MKRIYKIVALFFTVLLLVACDKDEDNLLISENNAKTEISASKSEVVLQKDSQVADALVVTMKEPKLGVSVVPKYQLSFKVGENPEKKLSLPLDNLSVVFNTKELNKLLLDLGAEPEIAADVVVYGIVMLGTKEITTEPITIKATAYAMKLDLTTTWGIVGSGTPNGWNGPDVPLYKSTTNPEEMVAYVTLVDGEIKFRENNDWGNNYGGADGVLAKDGNNIAVTAGTYKVTVNLIKLTYELKSYSWGIVGSGAPNGWDGPDASLTYDPTSDMWKTAVKLSAGEIKFRQNNDWAVNFGDDGADGTLEEGGANIPVSAGNYLVEANFNTNTYKLTPIDYIWGLVGSATPNGWDGPDVQMMMDFSKEGVWYVNGVTLVDGEMKFRANNDWALNYGDDGADGTLEEGGTNIAVTAGKYNVVLDLSDAAAPTYTLKAQ